MPGDVRAKMREVLTCIVAQLAASTRLDAESRGDAQREARLLTAAVLDVAPGTLARTLDDPLTQEQHARVLQAAHRRANGEPLAYAVGTAAFRHLVLHVDARVLIPRPETEIVVEAALAVTAQRSGGIAVDIGTGSGAIALSLATEGHFDHVWATDISRDALEVAIANYARQPAGTTPVTFASGADFAPLAGVKARVIVSNPPYIAYSEAAALPASVRDWEPSMALFAADNGMARYDVLLAGAADHLELEGWLVLEVDARRATDTMARAVHHGFVNVRLIRDLSDRDRVLVAQSA